MSTKSLVLEALAAARSNSQKGVDNNKKNKILSHVGQIEALVGNWNQNARVPLRIAKAIRSLAHAANLKLDEAELMNRMKKEGVEEALFAMYSKVDEVAVAFIKSLAAELDAATGTVSVVSERDSIKMALADAVVNGDKKLIAELSRKLIDLSGK